MTPEEQRAKRAAYMRGYYARNHERIREAERVRRAASPEARRVYQRQYRKDHPEQDRAWKKVHPEVMRRWRLANATDQNTKRNAKRYAVALSVAQEAATPGRPCDLCDLPERVQRNNGLCLDHDHADGRLRGMICVSCNISLGYYERGNMRTKFHRLGITEKVDRYLR